MFSFIRMLQFFLFEQRNYFMDIKSTVSENMKQIVFQYVTYLHANSIFIQVSCFHMKFQASSHQPRDTTCGASEQMVAPILGSKRNNQLLSGENLKIKDICNFMSRCVKKLKQQSWYKVQDIFQRQYAMSLIIFLLLFLFLVCIFIILFFCASELLFFHFIVYCYNFITV